MLPAITGHMSNISLALSITQTKIIIAINIIDNNIILILFFISALSFFINILLYIALLRI